MAGKTLNIKHNRSSQKISNRELVARLLWCATRFFFRNSPRPFFAWRRLLLRIFGAKIGTEVHIYNSATIYIPWNLQIGDWSSIGEYAYIYNLGKVTIGAQTTISQRAHICAGTHDYNDPTLPLIKSPIIIKDQAWICADSFVGPGVTIGEGAITGARSVVTKDVGPWDIVAGNPAKFIKKRKLKG